jgi:hypothetical protein
MAFSKIKIVANEHGKNCKVTLDGNPVPGCFDVSFQANVKELTVATLKCYATVEAEGEAIARQIVLCPGCAEQREGANFVIGRWLRWRRWLKGLHAGFSFIHDRPKDATEFGDKNRKYVPQYGDRA